MEKSPRWMVIRVDGLNPELSVAVGTVQFTSAENVSRSAYTTKGLTGHGASNDGGRISDMPIKF